MAHHTRHSGLRVDVPTLEPDAVVVERLAAASARSTPSRRTSRSVGLRAAFVAAVVASLGATTWAAGALPGVDTPFRHREIQHAPLVPLAPTGDVGSPQSGGPAPGGPAGAGGPHDPSHPARGRGQARGHRNGSRGGKHGVRGQHGHRGEHGRHGKHGGHGPQGPRLGPNALPGPLGSLNGAVGGTLPGGWPAGLDPRRTHAGRGNAHAGPGRHGRHLRRIAS
jgi:hypothetical protein